VWIMRGSRSRHRSVVDRWFTWRLEISSTYSQHAY
jgi:hypothetical protein